MCNLFLCGVVDHVTWCFVVKVFVNKSANFCFSLSLSLLFVLIPVLSSLIMNYTYVYSAWRSTVQHVCGSCDHVAKHCTHGCIYILYVKQKLKHNTYHVIYQVLVFSQLFTTCL